MTKIFISYRRADSQKDTGRIYDHLVEAFGKENIFIDVANIPLGKDFRGVLREAVVQCDVMLVIIGKTWLDIADSQGSRRLDDPSDFVRIEVESGLQRDGCLVIPILVDNASMPIAAALPISLRELAFKNATRVRDDPDFRNDVTKIIGELGARPAKAASQQQEDLTQSRKLEAAMPRETTKNMSTEMWVKISLPDSIGLIGELPDYTRSGDLIEKGDARGTTFPITFPKDKSTGKLAPATVCLLIESPDFEVTSEIILQTVCSGKTHELEIPVNADSRTMILSLAPKSSDISLGRSRLIVNLLFEGKVIGQVSVSTEIIAAEVRRKNWVLNTLLMPLLGYAGSATIAEYAPQPAPSKHSNSLNLLPPLFAWVDIPAGQVTLEDNRGTYEVAPFAIAKYPITNAQFAVFIEAGGYHERGWWTDVGWAQREHNRWTEPSYWGNKQWNGAEQPVVGVSWYESLAFCLWLSDVSGDQILLPTEQQWQRAAQGDDGRIYPWGNDWNGKRCNHDVDGNGIGKTTPVSAYEGKGDSPFGVVDMAGNTLEWCLNIYRSGEIFIDVDDQRVVRGSSWNNQLAGHAKVTLRNQGHPDSRYYFVGFRICRIKQF